MIMICVFYALLGCRMVWLWCVSFMPYSVVEWYDYDTGLLSHLSLYHCPSKKFVLIFKQRINLKVPFSTFNVTPTPVYSCIRKQKLSLVHFDDDIYLKWYFMNVHTLAWLTVFALISMLHCAIFLKSIYILTPNMW